MNDKPWEIRLYDRADGIKGHYCIGRYTGSYHEWITESGEFGSAGKLYTSFESAQKALIDFLQKKANTDDLIKASERVAEALKDCMDYDVRESFGPPGPEYFFDKWKKALAEYRKQLIRYKSSVSQ